MEYALPLTSAAWSGSVPFQAAGVLVSSDGGIDKGWLVDVLSSRTAGYRSTGRFVADIAICIIAASLSLPGSQVSPCDTATSKILSVTVAGLSQPLCTYWRR